MYLNYKLSVAPAEEPVTVQQVKTQLRYDGSDWDNTIQDVWIPAARRIVEEYTNSALVTQTWKLYLNDWPKGGLIYLPKGPVQSVTSITYIDDSGITQTVPADDYNLGLNGQIGIIKHEEYWPLADTDYPEAIVVTYVTGYGASSAVPETLKQAIVVLCGDMYQAPQSFVKGSISTIGWGDKPLWQQLCDPYIIYY